MALPLVKAATVAKVKAGPLAKSATRLQLIAKV
jgi:hypothetical protein